MTCELALKSTQYKNRLYRAGLVSRVFKIDKKFFCLVAADRGLVQPVITSMSSLTRRVKGSTWDMSPI